MPAKPVNATTPATAPHTRRRTVLRAIWAAAVMGLDTGAAALVLAEHAPPAVERAAAVRPPPWATGTSCGWAAGRHYPGAHSPAPHSFFMTIFGDGSKPVNSHPIFCSYF